MPTPSRKSVKGPASVKGPQLPTSYALRLAGPALVLRAEVKWRAAACQPTGSAALLLTGGRRLGHIAALCPDDPNVLVVVGGAVLDAAPDAEAAEGPHKTGPPVGCGGGGAADEDSCCASPTQGLTPSEQPLPLSSTTDGPARSAAVVEVPAAWRTPFPFMECYDTERGVWFVPPGQIRRSDVVGGGSMRWPTQAAGVLLWAGDAPATPPPLRSQSSTQQRRGDAPPAHAHGEREGGSDAKESAPQAGEEATAAAVAARSPSPKKKRKASPSTFDRLTYSQLKRTPRDRKAKAGAAGDAAAAVAAAPTAGEAATAAPEGRAVYLPVGLSMGPSGNGAARGQAPVPSVRRLPAEVVLFGGWDGAARLSAVLTYFTGEIPSGATDAEVAAAFTLPTASELPALPPVSHHSCTSINGSVYCFGGNTIAGCGNEVRVLTSARLRRAHALEKEAQRQRQQREMRSQRGSTVHAGQRRSAVLGMSTSLSASRRSEELPRAPPPLHGSVSAAEDAGSTPSQPLPAETDEWACAVVVWPPVAPLRGGGSAPTSPVASEAPQPEERAAAAAAVVHVPAPAPRSSHAAACLGNRYLVVVGGRRLALPTDAPTPPTDTKGRRSKSVTKPAVSPAAPAKKAAKGSGGAAGVPVGAWEAEEAAALPKLTLLSDVAVFDTEERCWVQATVTGGEAPEPRYAAAMCTIPSGSGTELLLHGGVGGGDRVLGDAWLLTTAARDSAAGPSDGPSDGPSGGAGRAGAAAAKRKAPPAATTEGGVERSPGDPRSMAAAAAAQPLVCETDPHTGAKSVCLRWVRVDLAGAPHGLRRAHHALVATPQREVFFIGGRHSDDAEEAVMRDSLSPRQTLSPSPAPPLLTSNGVASLVVPPLQTLAQVPLA